MTQGIRIYYKDRGVPISVFDDIHSLQSWDDRIEFHTIRDGVLNKYVLFLDCIRMYHTYIYPTSKEETKE